MSIKSTKYISRDFAVDRIKHIYNLIKDYNYIELESTTTESEYSIAEFVNNSQSLLDISNIEKYTNSMLEGLMDMQFFRESMFDNYIIK